MRRPGINPTIWSRLRLTFPYRAIPAAAVLAKRQWCKGDGYASVTTAIILPLLAICLSGRAYAALGENVSSVARDHAALHGSLVSTPMQQYDVQEMVTDTGTRVREYSAHGGPVFAVTWSGTQVPDLSLLLGTYFDRYVAAAKAHRTGHHVLSVNTPSLAMSIVRFQRSSSGQVYVPSLMPHSVTRRELR